MICNARIAAINFPSFAAFATKSSKNARNAKAVSCKTYSAMLISAANQRPAPRSIPQPPAEAAADSRLLSGKPGVPAEKKKRAAAATDAAGPINNPAFGRGYLSAKGACKF